MWNWQQEDWPNFRYDGSQLANAEACFLRQSGLLTGTARHLSDDDKAAFTVDGLCAEALKTSEIEGEYLDRASVQSSIRRQFGLQADARRAPPAERGAADMMIELYRLFAQPLTHATLRRWNRLLVGHRADLKDTGRYRTHDEPMQVVSGPLHRERVHFEAPPSSCVRPEMNRFIAWFNRTGPHGAEPLPLLARASMAHLYFVCIHPFEDGNGRIARALAEKSLAESLGEPTLIALSETIGSDRKAYYAALEQSNKENEITAWIRYFAQAILDAQIRAGRRLHFLIEKTRWHDQFRGKLNARQMKMAERLFREGPDGFKGGLSAENYLRMTGASRATATRDLQDLVEKTALLRSGQLKATRYYLNIRPV